MSMYWSSKRSRDDDSSIWGSSSDDKKKKDKKQKRDKAFYLKQFAEKLKVLEAKPNKSDNDNKRIKYLTNLVTNKNIPESLLKKEWESEEKDIKYEEGIDKVIKAILADTQVKAYKHKAAWENLVGDITPALGHFKKTGSDIASILESIVGEIVRDKMKIRELEGDKKAIQDSITELSSKSENTKLGYKRILDDNNNLRNENAKLIDENERLQTQALELNNTNKLFEDKTRNIIKTRKILEDKLKKVDTILKLIDDKLGNQIGELMPKELDMEALGLDMLGAGMSASFDRKIMKKLNIDEVDILPIIGAFLSNKLKTKNDLTMVLNVLDVSYKTADNKTELVKKILKKLKKLSKKDIEYLKTL